MFCFIAQQEENRNIMFYGGKSDTESFRENGETTFLNTFRP